MYIFMAEQLHLHLLSAIIQIKVFNLVHKSQLGFASKYFCDLILCLFLPLCCILFNPLTSSSIL